MKTTRASRTVAWSSSLLLGLAAWKCTAQAAPQPGGQAGPLRSDVETTLNLPSERPPQAPRIACADGQLGIVADNATLGSVVASIHACLGIPVDLPEGTAGDRVFANLGPGSPQQVLQEFLSSTELNYVIQSSVIDPNKIQAVLLSERTAEPKVYRPLTVDARETPTRRAWIENRNAIRAAQAAGEERMASEAISTESTTPEQSAVPDQTANATSASVVPASPEQPADGSTTSAQPATQAGGADSPQVAAQPSGTSGSTSESPVAEPVADTPAAKATQQGILNLEQMFEQRKKMMEGQTENLTPK